MSTDTNTILFDLLGRTVCRDPRGKSIFEFPSLLPGGHQSCSRLHSYCILDCIYISSSGVFYVLDVMCWGGHPVYNCATDFRVEFWRLSKLSELDAEVASMKHIAPHLVTYRFLPAPLLNCQTLQFSQLTATSPAQLFSTINDPPPLDGLLLLHKAAHYRPGVSPLACWVSCRGQHEESSKGFEMKLDF